MLTGNQFGAIGPVTSDPAVTFGIDCYTLTYPNNILLKAIDGTPQCVAATGFANVLLPIGAKGSQFCVRSSQGYSFTIDCPPTGAPTTSQTDAPTTSPTPFVTKSSVCVPQFKMDKNACTRRINTCKGQNIKMKWTGTGCKDKRGKKLGDGGCQCVGNCGYQCAKACRADRECKWEKGACMTKGGKPGQPMTSCLVPA